MKHTKLIGIIASIVVIAAISWIYFYPDAMQGNELRQHDMQQGVAIGQEAKAFTEATGETTRWTNSLFSGMPNFQIAPSYPSNRLISWIGTAYSLGFPSPVNLVFIMMLGFFILLLAMKVRWYLALPGAIAYGFSSYFFIIIGAGHIWKFVTLAYIPPTIAGIVWCYRGKYLLGGAVAALFAMMQIASNHIQMSYYFLFVIAGFVIAYFCILLKKKNLRQWCIATGVLAIAGALAVTANLPNLYNTYEYSKETMRGGHSELTPPGGTTAQASTGLDKDYITAWSYGRDETLTLLIPNIKGGATIKPEKGDNKLLSLYDTDRGRQLVATGSLAPEEAQFVAQFPQYFGDQPMTNGPVYVGAFVFALFILGCVIVKGPMKWTLLALTLFSIFLSWGHNMMWLTDWFIDHFPMYNKFRTVASILVIAEFTIPLLAILALKQLFASDNMWRQYRTTILASFGVCMAICALGFIAPEIFGSSLSSIEDAQLGAYRTDPQYRAVFGAIDSIRMSLVSDDALRSFILIGVGLGILWLFATRKIGKPVACLLITAFIAGDLYAVNKRYLDSESFVPRQLTQGDPFPMREVDRQILADTDMNYRVLDIPNFDQAAPSYRHKMIGGYHAAKLTRYQDMIDRHLGNFRNQQPDSTDWNVLNMLNARYIVVSDNEVFQNPDALGNAWWVDKVEYVAGADAEMDALDHINPAVTAVSDTRFKEILGTTQPVVTPGDTIYETSYAPNELRYRARSARGGVAVFSEVYFPWGWKATVNGKETPIARVDYLLRAMRLPAGEYDVVMRFDPPSVHATVTAAYISIIAIYVALAAAIVMWILAWRRKNSNGHAA